MKSNLITIGHAGDKPVSLDIEMLLRTRMLVQANSGGGKSWLLRRLAEQLFGRVPVIIIDPEGEFATLRDKFGFVLVGKGGETPADCRSAALVAHKLLELRASAVCDLYEMKPFERHRWVKLFLEACIDAPKNLWRPTVFIGDEFHTFCPEKGAGESEASEACISLGTRGRKRGFCLIAATQRIGKLRKDLAAELLNVLIGPTFIDIDRKRAAECLGVPGNEVHKFFDEIKVLSPGHFFALGRAVAMERTRLIVGPVQTTHPEAGATEHALEAPPTPEAVKAMLPKLADLPKKAEEKAKTETELRTEIRSLKAQLSARPIEKTEVVKEKPVEVPVLVDTELHHIKFAIKNFEAVGKLMQDAKPIMETILRELSKFTVLTGKNKNRWTLECQTPKKPLPPISALRGIFKDKPQRENTVIPNTGIITPQQDGELTGPEQRILDAIAWMESIGVNEPEQTAVAFLAGYTFGGGAFNNPKGRLRGLGMVEYRGNNIALTELGRSAAKPQGEPLTTEELHRRVMDRLPGPEQRILKPLLEAYPQSMTKNDLAQCAGYTPGAGAFNNPCGRLRSLGLVEYPQPGQIVARSILFLV